MKFIKNTFFIHFFIFKLIYNVLNFTKIYYLNFFKYNLKFVLKTLEIIF